MNIAGEASKSGVSPEELWPLLELCAAQPHIQVRGLMAVPPVNRDDRQNRADLAAVHRLYVRAGEQGYSNVRMEILSMGMSGDFEMPFGRVRPWCASALRSMASGTMARYGKCDLTIGEGKRIS